MSKYKITIDVENASMSVEGEYLGMSLAYLIKGLEPFLSLDEITDFAYDMLDGLPDDHPCRRRVKFTNRIPNINIPEE
jgi:hypothetical protein